MKMFVRRDRIQARLIIMLVIFILAGIDRLTKLLITANMELHSTISLIKFGDTEVLNFTHVRNTGGAFSILQGQWLFLTLMSGLIMVGLLAFLMSGRLKSKLMIVALTLAAGGAGNLIDRVLYGYVVDFIDFRIINFAIFNFADICVVTGVFIAAFATIREDIMNRKQKNIGDDDPVVPLEQTDDL